MQEFNIKPKDMLQIQTKAIQYVSNIALDFELEGSTIHVQPKKNHGIVRRDGNTISFESTAYTISDNTILAHYIEKIGAAINKNTLRQSCLELTELLPNRFREIDIETQIDDLLSLYALYHCYLRLIWDIPINNQAVLDHLKKYSQPLIDDQEHLCWGFVCFVRLMLVDESITVNLIVNPPDISELLHTHSLYIALLYQLLMHIAAGKNATHGGFATCESCGNTFFRERRHKKYCDLCDRPCERTKACRAKKKEAQHAQESNP